MSVPVVPSRLTDQPSFPARAVWFLFVGWWLTGLWLSAAWLLTVTIVGIPLGVWTYNKLPFVVSLYHY